MSFRRSVITAITALTVVWYGAATAAVYKSVDAEGNVVYTDNPAGNAKPVDLPPLSTVPAPKYDPNLFKPKETEDQAGAYQSVSIVSPGQDESIRENSGAVSVSASVKPKLDTKAGHRFMFYMDGESVGEATASDRIVFENVDRGTHNVSVAVVDGGGKELMRSEPVTFHLHRVSVQAPPRPTPFRAP